jgi:hypothetical protein
LIGDMLEGFFEEMAVHSVCRCQAGQRKLGVGQYAPTAGALSNATSGILKG